MKRSQIVTAVALGLAGALFTSSALGQYTPGTYTPGTYTPGTYTPGNYTPSTFTPSTYTPSTYTPSTSSSNGVAPLIAGGAQVATPKAAKRAPQAKVTAAGTRGKAEAAAKAKAAAAARNDQDRLRSDLLRAHGDRLMNERVLPKLGVKQELRGSGPRSDSVNHDKWGGRDWKMKKFNPQITDAAARKFVNESARAGTGGRAIIEQRLPKDPAGSAQQRGGLFDRASNQHREKFVHHRTYRDDRRDSQGGLIPNDYVTPKPRSDWGPHLHTDFNTPKVKAWSPGSADASRPKTDQKPNRQAKPKSTPGAGETTFVAPKKSKSPSK